MNDKRGQFGVSIIVMSPSMSDRFVCKVLQVVDWIFQVLVPFRVSALGIPIIGIPREKWDFTFPISQGKILKIPWEKFWEKFHF